MAVRGCTLPMRFKAAREALTPEFATPEAKIVWGLRAILFGFFVYALALNLNPQYTTKWLMVSYPLWGIVISLGFAFVPTRRPRTLKTAEAFTHMALLLHVAGHALDWYDLWWYDKALHFVNPLVAVFILFALSQATDWIWNWRRVTPVEVGIYTFCMAVTVGAVWEIIEFGMDELAGTDEQNGLSDTMVDLILDVIGGAIGAIVVAIATRIGREKGHDAIAEEPKRRLPRRAPGPGEPQ